jgi:2-polyprenyl-3-methyl-5-hydroxy-6-metoxy-1,4-benzoquinol methylase
MTGAGAVGGPRLVGPNMIDFDKYRQLGAYHWRLLASHADYRARVDAVLRRVRPGARCLDLGCGDGAYAGHVAPKAARVVGVDGDPDAIRCATAELAARRIANVALIRSTFAELPRHLPPSRHRFDLIWSMDCIEHLVDPGELVDTIARYLAPGGRVLVGTPLFVSGELVSKYHVREYTAAEVDRLLARRFVKVGSELLPAPVPGSGELLPRFYVHEGRRRRWWGR